MREVSQGLGNAPGSPHWGGQTIGKERKEEERVQEKAPDLES